MYQLAALLGIVKGTPGWEPLPYGVYYSS